MFQLSMGNVMSVVGSQPRSIDNGLEERLSGLSPDQLQLLQQLLADRLSRQPGEVSAGNNREEGLCVRSLTEREQEVLTLIARGYTRPDIAEALGISRNTAATHIASIYRKLEIGSIAEATMIASRWGFVA